MNNSFSSRARHDEKDDQIETKGFLQKLKEMISCCNKTDLNVGEENLLELKSIKETQPSSHFLGSHQEEFKNSPRKKERKPEFHQSEVIIKELQVEIEKLKKQFKLKEENYNKTIGDLQKSLKSDEIKHKKSFEDQQKVLRTNEDKCRSLQKTIFNLENSVLSKNQEIEREKNILETIIKQKETEIDVLTSNLKSMETNSKETKRKLQESCFKADTLERKVEELKENIKNKEIIYDQYLKKIENESKAFKVTIESKKVKIKELKESFIKKENSYRSLSKELDLRNQKEKQYEEKIEKLKQKLKNIEIDHCEIKQNINSIPHKRQISFNKDPKIVHESSSSKYSSIIIPDQVSSLTQASISTQTTIQNQNLCLSEIPDFNISESVCQRCRELNQMLANLTKEQRKAQSRMIEELSAKDQELSNQKIQTLQTEKLLLSKLEVLGEENKTLLERIEKIIETQKNSEEIKIDDNETQFLSFDDLKIKINELNKKIKILMKNNSELSITLHTMSQKNKKLEESLKKIETDLKDNKISYEIRIQQLEKIIDQRIFEKNYEIELQRLQNELNQVLKNQILHKEKESFNTEEFKKNQLELENFSEYMVSLDIEVSDLRNKLQIISFA